MKKIVNDSAECLEKIMKAFLATKGGVRPESLKSYNHNLEKIRAACSNSDIFFNQENLKIFCKNFSGIKKGTLLVNKGNEIFRYGFQQNTGTHGVDLGKLLNLVDEFFLGTLIKIDDSVFVAATSNIAALICQTHSADHIRGAMTQEQVKNLQIAICKANNFSDNFIRKINEFNLKIKKFNT